MKIAKLIPLFLLSASTAHAAIIVSLDPVDAKYAGGATGISGSTQTGTVQSSGLTFNITFTPATVDLTGLVTLMEIGGQSNGSALYLLDGVPVFLSKTGGGVVSIPDTTMGSPGQIGVAHGGGSLTAGVQTTVAAVYNPVSGALSLAVGSTPVTSTFTISNPQLNWNGNNSLSVGLISVNAGDRAGTDNLGGTFDQDDIKSLAGTIDGDAYYWNALGSVIPEPSAALLGGLGLLALLRRRRA